MNIAPGEEALQMTGEVVLSWQGLATRMEKRCSPAGQATQPRSSCMGFTPPDGLDGYLRHLWQGLG